MYPDGALIRLAGHKAALRADIGLRRTGCAVAAARVVRPLEWLDRMRALWRQFGPMVKLVAVPAGMLMARTVFPRRKMLGSFIRWSPLLLGAVCGVGTMVGTRASSPPRSRDERHRRRARRTPV